MRYRQDDLWCEETVVGWEVKKTRVAVTALVRNSLPAVALFVLGATLMRWNRQIASVVLLVGAFLLFLRTYRRPWPLRWFTCLLPAVGAVGGYLLQVLLLDVSKPVGPMGAGLILGAVFGAVRGRAHRLDVDGTAIRAHRTIVVLVLWLLTYLLTQASAILGRSVLVEWGFAGGAFTTAIVVVFSLVLFARYLRLRSAMSFPSSPQAPAAVAVGCTLAFLAACGLVAAMPMEAFAAEPARVVLDGDWELDRREHEACVVAVPPVISGSIHIEADYEAGTVVGRFDGAGAGSYTLPAECDTANPSEYDRTHLEVWTAEFSTVQATFTGPFDPATGAFEIEASVHVEGWGERAAPGHQYMCSTDVMTPTCVFPEFVPDQTATVAGVVGAGELSLGEIDWYTAYCASTSPEQTSWGRYCPTVGGWVASPTSVEWQPNSAPEVGGIAATPGEPTEDDTVELTVDASDPDGDELTYTWFIDGEQSGVSAPVVSWPRPTFGDHSVRVVVSDGAETVEAFLDVRVYSGSGVSDRDDDGVGDDDDRCPDEWGSTEDGCPPFAATVGCSPARPLPESAVTCAASVSGAYPDEEKLFEWYLDGSSVQSGGADTWTWPASTAGDHEVEVDVGGEGRSATATVAVIVGGGLVDAATAGFTVGAVGCNSGISSDEILGCSATITRTRDDVGLLSVAWTLNGSTVASEATEGGATSWSLDTPPSGDHIVQVFVVDPVTNYAQSSSGTAVVRAGSAELADQAVAAAAVTAVALLLAGTGLNTFSSVASTYASMSSDEVENAIRDAASEMDQLIDPRDGHVLEADGDSVYWDDDVGWIDRSLAVGWVAELATQRLERDQQVEGTWAEIQQGRDEYYQQREWELQRDGYRWDPDRQAYVHPAWIEHPVRTPTIADVYFLQDLIDDNAHLLNDRMQQSVRDNLAQLDFSADRVDFSNVDAGQFDRLQSLALAVSNTVVGQRWAQAAASDMAGIDRAETNEFVRGFGLGLVRFGLSRIDPTQGIFVGALFGWGTAPPGQGIKHAIIGGVSTFVDVRASALAPASFLWNAGTGGAIGGTEQLLYGGSWEDIKRGALFGAAANGIFSTLQSPTVRGWMGDPATTGFRPSGMVDDGGLVRFGASLEDGGSVRPGMAEPDGGGPARPIDDGAPARSPVAEPDGVRTSGAEDGGDGLRRGDSGDEPSSGSRPGDDPYADLPPIEETFPTRGPVPDADFADAPQRPGAVVTENTAEAWTARDEAIGIQREPHVPMGVDEVPGFVANRDVEWLTQTDRVVREVWQDVGGGREPDSWNRFVNGIEQRIQSGDLDAGQVDGWFHLNDQSLGSSQPGGFVRGMPAPGDFDSHLVPGYIDRVIASDNPARQLALFQDGGQRNLGLWEQLGVITPEQAAALNTRASAAVNEAVLTTTPEVVRRFEIETGVTVKGTYVGDYGSSSEGGPRSVGGTDNDRTFVSLFDGDDVAAVAQSRYPDLPESQAITTTRQELLQQYAGFQAEATNNHLRSNYGVDAADLGAGTYGGVSVARPGGPTDLYGGGTVRTNLAVRGQAVFIEPDGSHHPASGDALVDAEHLQRTGFGSGDEAAPPSGDVRRMTAADYQATLQQQAHVASGIDPGDLTRPQLPNAAKAVLRAADAGTRLGTNVMDPDIVAVANRLRLEPQNAPQVLADAGMTMRTFLERARASVLHQVEVASS